MLFDCINNRQSFCYFHSFEHKILFSLFLSSFWSGNKEKKNNNWKSIQKICKKIEKKAERERKKRIKPYFIIRIYFSFQCVFCFIYRCSLDDLIYQFIQCVSQSTWDFPENNWISNVYVQHSSSICLFLMVVHNETYWFKNSK